MAFGGVHTFSRNTNAKDSLSLSSKILTIFSRPWATFNGKNFFQQDGETFWTGREMCGKIFFRSCSMSGDMKASTLLSILL